MQIHIIAYLILLLTTMNAFNHQHRSCQQPLSHTFAACAMITSSGIFNQLLLLSYTYRAYNSKANCSFHCGRIRVSGQRKVHQHFNLVTTRKNTRDPSCEYYRKFKTHIHMKATEVQEIRENNKFSWSMKRCNTNLKYLFY